jgi:hypothetical protein
MPYRIKARNKLGQTVTRIDQNPGAQPVTDRAYAQQLAEAFAQTRGHGAGWVGYVEYYDENSSIASVYNGAKNTMGGSKEAQRPARLKPGNVWAE